jgi:hypothetical protein
LTAVLIFVLPDRSRDASPSWRGQLLASLLGDADRTANAGGNGSAAFVDLCQPYW